MERFRHAFPAADRAGHGQGGGGYRLLRLQPAGFPQRGRGNPERFGTSLEAFHGQNIERSRSRYQGLLATSTHDTKRSEDVRARINVLSEIPEQWRAALGRWRRLNRRRKELLDGQPVPDRNEGYLLYQTLVGAWPLDPGRGRDPRSSARGSGRTWSRRCGRRRSIRAGPARTRTTKRRCCALSTVCSTSAAPNPFLESAGSSK